MPKVGFGHSVGVPGDHLVRSAQSLRVMGTAEFFNAWIPKVGGTGIRGGTGIGEQASVGKQASVERGGAGAGTGNQQWAVGQSGRMAVAQQGRALRQLGSRNLMHAQCEFLVWWRQLSRDLRWSAKVWSRQEVEFLLEGLVDVKVTCDMFFVVTCCVGCHVNDDQVGGQLRVPG